MKKFISMDELKIGYILQESIKTADGKDLVTKGSVLTENMIERLKRWCAHSDCMFCVEGNDLEEKKETKEEVQEKTLDCLKDIYNANETELGQALEALKPCISYLYDDLKTIEDLPEDAIKIKFANDHGGHYFRVTQMAVALASLYNKEVNTSRKISLESICLASLLHDYGKRFENDEAALDKLRKDKESILKGHINSQLLKGSYQSENDSIYAYIALKNKVPEDVRLTILYCKYSDPTRQPASFAAMQSAKIITMCDTYDTLLQQVVEKDMQSPFENVISYMNQLAYNGSLDKDLYQLFLKHIPIYTNGMKVLLSTGEYGVVVNRSSVFPTMPTVLTLPTSAKAPSLIDLSETTNVIIRRIVQNEDMVSAKVDALQQDQLKDIRPSYVPDESTQEEESDDERDSIVLQNNISNQPKVLSKKIKQFLIRKNKGQE